MKPIPEYFELETARCVLRALRAADAPFIAAALRDGGFAGEMRWDLPCEEPALADAVRASDADWRAGRGFRFTIELRATRKPAGCIALRHEPRADDWSIGFWIAPPHRGCGYAVEAARAVVEFAFSYLQAAAVRAAHAQNNRPSRRVIEKLGMRFVREIGADELCEREYALGNA